MATEPTEDDIITDEPAKKQSKLFMVIGVITGALVLQAATVFIVVKWVGSGPEDIIGEEIASHADLAGQAEHEATQELLISKIRCAHTSTGQLFVIEMTVHAIVPKRLVGGSSSGDEEEEEEEEEEGPAQPRGIELEIANNLATIKDRLRTIVVSSEAGTLALTRVEKPDYGLSTLKRQFKTILDDVLGKGKVKEVVISHYMATPFN